VAQKDRYLRQLLIRDIEADTKRRLIVYFGNRYEGAQIDPRDVSFMAELCADLSNEPVDLMLETAGGLTDATEGLVAIVQKSAPDLRVVVVRSAKSNGTLLCLAASNIVMGPTSELGPIEPSWDGIPCTVLAAPEIAGQNFPLHKYGVWSLEQTKGLARRLLTNGMMKGRKPDEIDHTIRALSTRDIYFSHGSVIDSVEASQLGLSVIELEARDALWQKLWLLHCMYDHDCRRDRFVKVFEGRSVSTAIAAPPVPARQG
jgi:hypothetical protein